MSDFSDSDGETEWTEMFTAAGATQSDDKSYHIFIWKIRNFGTTHFPHGSKLSSPVFSSDSCGRTLWQLEMYPNGFNKTFKYYVSIFLRNVSNSGGMLSTQFTISFVDDDDSEYDSFTSKFTPSERNVCGHTRFIFRPVLLDKPHQLFPDGTLKVHCQLHGSVFVEGRHSVLLLVRLGPSSAFRKDKFIDTEFDKLKNSSSQDDNAQERFSEDLISILKSRKFGDVTFRTAGKEIGAHKAVLVARSSVFSSMFDHDMCENLDNCVEIADLTYKTVQQFITYIYDGIIGELNVESAMGLFSASDKYAIEELNVTCSKFLKNNLSVYN